MRSFRQKSGRSPESFGKYTSFRFPYPLARDLRCEYQPSEFSTSQGKALFAEGEPARGIYILRTGRATSSISSHEGRLVILRIALAGDVLGLNSVLRNSSYNTTVKTI